MCLSLTRSKLLPFKGFKGGLESIFFRKKDMISEGNKRGIKVGLFTFVGNRKMFLVWVCNINTIRTLC